MAMTEDSQSSGAWVQFPHGVSYGVGGEIGRRNGLWFRRDNISCEFESHPSPCITPVGQAA